MGIFRPKFSVPEIPGDPIETEKRMIGRTAPLFGVVADPSHFLFSIKDKNSRVQIEDYFGGRFGF